MIWSCDSDGGWVARNPWPCLMSNPQRMILTLNLHLQAFCAYKLETSAYFGFHLIICFQYKFSFDLNLLCKFLHSHFPVIIHMTRTRQHDLTDKNIKIIYAPAIHCNLPCQGKIYNKVVDHFNISLKRMTEMDKEIAIIPSENKYGRKRKEASTLLRIF